MKTVTQTKPFISSLEELHELTSENQLTAQDVIHRRMYINVTKKKLIVTDAAGKRYKITATNPFRYIDKVLN